MEVKDCENIMGRRKECRADCIGVTNLLLDLEAEIDVVDKRGYTALCVAAELGHTEMVKALAARGARVNHLTRRRNTPLFLALMRKNRATVLALRDVGARLFDNELPEIVETGTVDHLELLKEVNVDFSMRDKTGATLLHIAVMWGNEEAATWLLDNNFIDINAVDLIGATPLHYAVHGKLSMVKILVDRGAKIDAEDSDGATPLYLASDYGHTDVIRFLKTNCCV